MTAQQSTIGRETRFSGKALQTGRRVNVVCSPAGSGKGITFSRTDAGGEGTVSLNEMAVCSGPSRRTTIGSGGVRIQTVEHFLAALWCLGIDNIRVEIDGEEFPALDGSPMGFIECLKAAGTRELGDAKRPIKILEPIRVEDRGRYVSVLPHETFAVSYLIDYRTKCIGKQKLEMELDGGSFEREIAPARTFCTAREALILRLMGLGRGANFDNTLVLTAKGPIRTKFRFPDEPVRHKVADLVGDLYMLGRPLIGRVVADRSGHRLNGMLVKRIYEIYAAQ